MDENNILVRVTGEADLTAAQQEMQDLSSAAYDIGKALQDLKKSESAEIAELEKQRKASADLIASINERIKTEKLAANVIAQLKKQIADEEKNMANLGRQIDGVRAKYKPLIMAKNEELKANKQNAAEIQRSISKYKVMGGVAGSMRNQIRELTMSLQAMEAAGDTSSQTYIDMAVRLAKLTDAAGDTQAAIRLLASDTKNLDSAMQVGSGLTGAFNVATNAMALFGGESEELQQAFLKTQAVLAALNGVQQVAAVLDKRSAANIVLRAAWQKIFNKTKKEEAVATVASTGAKTAETGATTAATAAQWSLNAAIAANPVGAILIAVVALIAALAALFHLIKDDTSDIDRWNESMKQSQKELDRLNEKIDNRKTAHNAKLQEMQAEGASEAQLHAQKVANLEEEQRLQQEAFNKEKQMYIDAVNQRNKILKSKMSSSKKEKRIEEMGLTDEDIATLKENYRQAGIALKEAQTSYYVEVVGYETEQEKKRTEEAKKRAEERRRAIADAENQLADIRIALMKDGADKEIARINLDFDRKIAEIKGNSKAEIALRAALEQQRAKEIQNVNDEISEAERKQQEELAKLRLQNELKVAEDAGGQRVYELRAEILAKQAELEKSAIKRSIENEELRAAKIREIDLKLKADLEANERSRANEEVATARSAAERRVKEAENAALAILNDENSTNEQIKAARETLANHEANLRDIRMQEIKAQLKKGLITEQEFQDQKLDIEREALDAEREMIAERTAQTQELVNNILSFVSDMASEIFGAISDNINRQLEDLDNLYTTDAEEAKENANKKYISEKELEDKKLELKRKAAAVEKAEAAFNIAMNTAMAIMRIWADVPKVDFGATTIVMTAMAAALGATQLAMVLAKPLPQYANGRRGGEGEFAMVGERGAELMYIPQGASIVPHDKLSRPELWGQYGIPKGKRPIMPHIDPEIAGFAIAQQMGYGIDYDKLGRTIMDNVRIPAQKAVHVNVDRTGILVSEGNDTHHILNHKYEAAWT